MAILKILPGVKATICSDGHGLKEYKKKEPLIKPALADRAISKLTECTTDTESSFKIRVSQPYQLDCPCLVFSIYVDGRSVGGLVCGEYELIHGRWAKEMGVKQLSDKRNIVDLRKFRFSEIVTNDGAEHAQPPKGK